MQRDRKRTARLPCERTEPARDIRAEEEKDMTRESLVRTFGLIVAAATVIVAVMALIHLF